LPAYRAGTASKGVPPFDGGGDLQDFSGSACAPVASASATVRVVFTPSGKRGTFSLGTTVLAAARTLGVDLDSVCGGRAVCGRCQVTPTVGEFAKHRISSKTDSLSEATDTEHRYARIKGLDPTRRLSCQAQLRGDCVIDVPAESQLHRQIVRKSADDIRDLQIDPVVKLHYIEPPRPSMEDQTCDLTRVVRALEAEWGLAELRADLPFLRSLSGALRAGQRYGGDWQVTVAVRNARDLVAVWPGLKERIFGIAVDVGTTTIAGHLCDLGTGEVLASAGMMNPQIRFGEDLMSRISYLQQNAGEAANLTAAVRGALQHLSTHVAEEAKVAPGDIVELVIVGNPTMHHLVLGIDPTQLGMEPFPLVVDQGLDVLARDLGLAVCPSAHAYFLPCIAGHVGADTAGVILSQAPHAAREMTLVIDVGTNAELVLGSSERLIACSSPTGPAFEGAQISCGQRAAPGAIERVRINPATLAPRIKVIGSDLWSDDPGFAASIEGIGVTGICGSGIIEAVAELFLCGVLDAGGRMSAKGRDVASNPWLLPKGRNVEYVLYQGSDRVVKIVPSDIRAIQLAKAACYSGARLLMDKMGVKHVDRVLLAGAFGSHIDVKYAMTLGMIPDCSLDHVRSVGNAAGTGARIALLSAAARDEIDRVIRRVEKVETAIEPKFQQYFVSAMSLPNADDPFPNLEQVVKLPPRSATVL
jgi:uncharacterized 2Fe-2S/4Fe-4S cluster protein (DUF4445 family)